MSEPWEHTSSLAQSEETNSDPSGPLLDVFASVRLGLMGFIGGVSGFWKEIGSRTNNNQPKLQ
jgi:hypothetical protein